MSLNEVLTLLIALYGAGLATFTFLQQAKEKRAHVKVTFTIGLLPWPGREMETVILLTASNPGHKKVILNTPGITLPDKKQLIFFEPNSNVRFPYSLEPEASCVVWYNIKAFAEELTSQGFYGKVNLVAYFTDSVGRKHESKNVTFNIDNWMGK
jgi:hypothetical protein